ncbi:MAG: 30S ribosomal protein S6--L-glutamate ligase, partial [Okeania sp. SIO4D6]|nr:30S ribosomal protein S6--L-glutamate ligase [Okeania sp. SIO4D6]
MKIAILSTDSTLYSTKKLLEAGKKQGHKVQVIDYLRCYMNITSMK